MAQPTGSTSRRSKYDKRPRPSAAAAAAGPGSPSILNYFSPAGAARTMAGRRRPRGGGSASSGAAAANLAAAATAAASSRPRASGGTGSGSTAIGGGGGRRKKRARPRISAPGPEPPASEAAIDLSMDTSSSSEDEEYERSRGGGGADGRLALQLGRGGGLGGGSSSGGRPGGGGRSGSFPSPPSGSARNKVASSSAAARPLAAGGPAAAAGAEVIELDLDSENRINGSDERSTASSRRRRKRSKRVAGEGTALLGSCTSPDAAAAAAAASSTTDAPTGIGGRGVANGIGGGSSEVVVLLDSSDEGGKSDSRGGSGRKEEKKEEEESDDDDVEILVVVPPPSGPLPASAPSAAESAAAAVGSGGAACWRNGRGERARDCFPGPPASLAAAALPRPSPTGASPAVSSPAGQTLAATTAMAKASSSRAAAAVGREAIPTAAGAASSSAAAPWMETARPLGLADRGSDSSKVTAMTDGRRDAGKGRNAAVAAAASAASSPAAADSAVATGSKRAPSSVGLRGVSRLQTGLTASPTAPHLFSPKSADDDAHDTPPGAASKSAGLKRPVSAVAVPSLTVAASASASASASSSRVDMTTFAAAAAAAASTSASAVTTTPRRRATGPASPPTAKAPTPRTARTHSLALIRVPTSTEQTYPSLRDVPPDAYHLSTVGGGCAEGPSLTAGRPVLHPLRENQILGRTSGGQASTDGGNKVDLGIGNDADGVSRRQLRVVAVNVAGGRHRHHHARRHRPRQRRGYVTLEVFDSAPMGPTVTHFGSGRSGDGGGTAGTPGTGGTGTAAATAASIKRNYGPGKEVHLRVGDVITFDPYFLHEREPRHIFQLVRFRIHDDDVDDGGYVEDGGDGAAARGGTGRTAVAHSSVGRRDGSGEGGGKAAAIPSEMGGVKEEAGSVGSVGGIGTAEGPSKPAAAAPLSSLLSTPARAATARRESSSPSSSFAAAAASIDSATRQRQQQTPAPRSLKYAAANDACEDEKKDDGSYCAMTMAATATTTTTNEVEVSRSLEAADVWYRNAQTAVIYPALPLKTEEEERVRPSQELASDVTMKEQAADQPPRRSSERAAVKTEAIGDGDGDGDGAVSSGRPLRTPVHEELAKGDRFRVKFDALNFLGKRCKGWYFGTAERIEEVEARSSSSSSAPQEYQIHLKFDDNSTSTEVYPGDGIERLLPSNAFTANSGANLLAAETALYPERLKSKEGAEAAAYDPIPSLLRIGDLVDCHYQDGGSNGAWYRGRVARVAVPAGDGGMKFDVAYDDGDYECNVPLRPGNVRLVERGSYDCSWLHGAKFEQPTFTRGRKNLSRKGRIVGFHRAEESTQLKVRFDDGSTEMVDYYYVAKILFSAQRETCVDLSKMREWPSEDKSAPDTLEEGQKSQKQKGPNARPRPSLNKPSRPAQKKAPVLDNHDIDRLLDELQASQCSQEQSFSESPQRLGSKKKAKEMHPSLANSLWSALNSAEPHNGARLLRHSAVFHNTIPNSSLSQQLFELMKTGPKNEGVSFRDPTRLEVASKYVSLILSKARTLDTLSIVAFGPSSWDDVEHCLRLPINETTKQAGSITSVKSSASAAKRLGRSLQVAASGVGVICKLLKHELGDATKEWGAPADARRLYVTKLTVKAALQFGVREALKSAVRWTAQCWIRHGYLVIGDGMELFLASSSDEEWCAIEAKRCLDSLGGTVAHLAWLYCAEESIEMKDNDCSFLIKDALLSELEKGPQREKESAAAWKQYTKRVKISFVLSLDTEFSSPLQSTLSKMLNLSKEMNVITGGLW